MLKTTLNDLNMHLFAEMERLDDEEIKGDDLQAEINRADAMSKVADQINKNGVLALRAIAVKNEYGGDSSMPDLLEDKHS